VEFSALHTAFTVNSQIMPITDKRKRSMKKTNQSAIFMFLTLTSSISIADDDARELVQLPEMMQQHMMSNMRDHLVAINGILANMGNGEMDEAAEIAEQRLGMSSLESHGASHMAKFMPEGMRNAGTSMHRAASRFALKVQEGELLPAYKMLSDVTSACVTCHSGYRIR
jgi:hypothetical protein